MRAAESIGKIGKALAHEGAHSRGNVLAGRVRGKGLREGDLVECARKRVLAALGPEDRKKHDEVARRFAEVPVNGTTKFSLDYCSGFRRVWRPELPTV